MTDPVDTATESVERLAVARTARAYASTEQPGIADRFDAMAAALDSLPPGTLDQSDGC